MITFQAKIIAELLYKNKIIKSEDKEVYIYGFEVLISSIFGFVIIISLGIIVNQLFNSIIFFMVFASTRLFCGGYHADTYLKCNIVFTFVFLIALFLFYVLKRYALFDYQIAFIILYLAAIFQYAPIDSEHKSLTVQEKQKYKRYSIILSLIWVLLSVVFCFFSREISIVITVTLFMVAMLMVIEKIKREEFCI